jgi:DNA (cytosine-5)-methyltransferase 1
MATDGPPQAKLRIADLFCGIGSMHIAAEELDMRCVYACDNDPHVRKAYQAHFGMLPDGDIREVKPVAVPDHDILCAGFPCQPFSRMGNKRGTNEERGRVVDYAIDVLRIKRPRAFILENVRGLLNSNNGEDFKRLQGMVEGAGYSFQYQMMRCEDFGIPQTRHRVFMVGMRDGHPPGFQYPRPLGRCPTLSEFLGIELVKPMSNTVRCSGRKSGVDNAKNWSAYRLKDGTTIEYDIGHVVRLQGFPADFAWGGAPESQKWKMLGNTIPTCLSRAILDAVGRHLHAHPEHLAQPLALVPHPPPARTIIERHLDECEKSALSRKRKRVVAGERAGGHRPVIHHGDGDEDEDGDDDGDAEIAESVATCDGEGSPPLPPPPPCKEKGDGGGGGEREEEEDDEEEEEPIPPYQKKPRTAEPGDGPGRFPCITIRSGTSITLTIPRTGGADQQLYMLKIIR